MDGHIWSFIGVLLCIVGLSAIDLGLYLRDNQLDEKLSALRKYVEGRKKELDRQERAIHEEMGNLTQVLFKASGMLQEFVNLQKWGSPYIDRSEALYEARGRGHSPGSGGAERGAGDQANLPDAQGEAGGGG